MKTEIFNVRLPRELTDWLDVLVKRGVYKSRAEAIRDFSRKFVMKGERRD